MSVARKLTGFLHDLVNPISISEADIREELECHLALRTQENLSRGMLEDDARSDAERRFGDFERSFRECRSASLGIRVWLQRIQLALIFGLGSAVVYLAYVMWEMQARHQSEVSTLQRQLETHDAPGVAGQVPTLEVDNRMPIRVWSVPKVELSTSVSWDAARADVPLNAPWCDWSALVEDH